MADLLSTVVGFASGWGLFELGELRRRWMNRRIIRQSVVAELGSAEVVLNSTVLDLSLAAGDMDRALIEFRWLKEHSGIPNIAALESLENIPDDQLKAALGQIRKLKTWDAPDVPLPILDGVLSNGAPGFSATEVSILSEIKRHVYFLSYRNQVMREYRQLYLTTEENSEAGLRIRAELDSSLNTFRKGAIYALDCIKEGLKVLPKAGGPLPRFKRHLTHIRDKLPMWITRFWA